MFCDGIGVLVVSSERLKFTCKMSQAGYR